MRESAQSDAALSCQTFLPKRQTRICGAPGIHHVTSTAGQCRAVQAPHPHMWHYQLGPSTARPLCGIVESPDIWRNISLGLRANQALQGDMRRLTPGMRRISSTAGWRIAVQRRIPAGAYPQ